MEKYGQTGHRKNTIYAPHNSGKNTLHIPHDVNALLFHGYSGYANAPKRYVIRTLPVLFSFPIFLNSFLVFETNLDYRWRSSVTKKKKHGAGLLGMKIRMCS